MTSWISSNTGLFVVLVTIVALVPGVIVPIVVHRKLRGPRIRGGVHAVLTVTAAGIPPHDAARANTTIVGVISGAGLTPVPVEREVIAPTSKWPYPGTHLPVSADPLDPTRFTVLWDQVPSSADIARQQAAQLAASGTVPTSTTFGPTSATRSFTSVTVNGKAVPADSIDPAAIEAALHGDPSAMLAAFDHEQRAGMGVVTGFTEVAGTPQVLLDLTVTPDGGGSPFAATLAVSFSSESPRRAAWCQVGARIPVRYDEADPAHAQIDATRI